MREKTEFRTVVTEVDQFCKALELIRASELRVVDTETTGLYFTKDFIVGSSVHALGQSFYFSFRHFEGPNLPEDLLETLGKELHAPINHYGKPTQLVGFNYQYDSKMWLADGVELPDVWEDPIIMAHTCNENEPSFKLERLAQRYVNPNAADDENALLATIKSKFPGVPADKAKGMIAYLSAEEAGQYAMQDVETTLDLYGFYSWYLKKQNLYSLYKEQRYFLRELTRMEMRGLPIDREQLEINSVASVKEAAKLKQALCDIAGHGVNPNSYPQMQALLGVKTTARDHLEIEVGVANPKIKGAKELLDFRRHFKAESTYYRPFRELMTPEGILHPNLRIAGGWADTGDPGGTVSGRISAQHPNLLAATRGHGEPISVRDVFVAPEGKILLEVDFSQAEMRVATHYADVKPMAKLFRGGADIHQGVADQLGIPRQIAKNVNFSFLYGIGAETFSIKYHLPRVEAKRYLGNYDRQYPGFRKLSKQCADFATKRGYIKMYTGRKRHFNTSGVLEKDAMNNLVQGSVGEMIRLAIVEIANTFDEEEVAMLLSVYDSILFAVDKSANLQSIMQILRRIMEPQSWCSVPIVVDFKTGDRWGGLEAYE